MNAKLITGALASALKKDNEHYGSDGEDLLLSLFSVSCDRVIPQLEGDKAPLRWRKRQPIASF